VHWREIRSGPARRPVGVGEERPHAGAQEVCRRHVVDVRKCSSSRRAASASASCSCAALVAAAIVALAMATTIEARAAARPPPCAQLASRRCCRRGPGGAACRAASRAGPPPAPRRQQRSRGEGRDLDHDMRASAASVGSGCGQPPSFRGRGPSPQALLRTTMYSQAADEGGESPAARHEDRGEQQGQVGEDGHRGHTPVWGCAEFVLAGRSQRHDGARRWAAADRRSSAGTLAAVTGSARGRALQPSICLPGHSDHHCQQGAEPQPQQEAGKPTDLAMADHRHDQGHTPRSAPEDHLAVRSATVVMNLASVHQSDGHDRVQAACAPLHEPLDQRLCCVTESVELAGSSPVPCGSSNTPSPALGAGCSPRSRSSERGIVRPTARLDRPRPTPDAAPWPWNWNGTPRCATSCSTAEVGILLRRWARVNQLRSPLPHSMRVCTKAAFGSARSQPWRPCPPVVGRHASLRRHRA